MRSLKTAEAVFLVFLLALAATSVTGQNAFCDRTGVNSECIQDQEHSLSEREYGFTSTFISEQSSSFTSSGISNIQIFNKTFLSGLWQGGFNISTNNTVVKSGAEFRPGQERIIIIGSTLPDEIPNPGIKSCDSADGSTGIYTINPSVQKYEAYCEMETDGGGWTHVATYADDGNDYWTSNNRDYIINGNEYNSLENGTNGKDFQSKAYSEVKADEVMVRRADNPNKYLIYDILDNQTLESRYIGGENIVGTFFVEEASGSWWRQCGNDIALRLQTPDGDGDGWNGDNGGYGFYFESVNNGDCSWDDYAGGVYGDDSGWGKNSENTWNRGFFYEQNFGGSAMEVFVRKNMEDNEFKGIDQGYVSGNIEWKPNTWSGSSNTGEIDIQCPNGDSSCWLYTQGKNITGTEILDINNGVAVQESGSRQYYLMYSNESIHTRFSTSSPHSDNADHFIAVARSNGKWYFDDNSNLYRFIPRKNDVLVANFTEGIADFNSYEGLE